MFDIQSEMPSITTAIASMPRAELFDFSTVHMAAANWTALGVFIALFLFRYTRTVVSIFTFTLYKPKPIAKNPKFKPKDVSVIIPTTFKTPHELLLCIRSVFLTGPTNIFIVTSRANVQLVIDLCCINSFPSIVVLGVDKLNKRNQILRAIPHVKTDIIVLADDDVFWPAEHGNYLKYLLAIFEDDNVGAGGTRQRVRREDSPSFWNFLGISYLERRVWNNATTNAIDGSISTLSGRTAAYRTKILKDPAFEHYFTHDTWRGKPLNSDDDKCLTRYVYSNGWNICLQFDPRSVLETTVEGDSKYLSQCMRWARAHWRGNFTVMENEKYWCSRKFWWGCYVIYIGQFQTPAIMWDSGFFGLLYLAVGGTPIAKPVFIAMAVWIFFTKIVKLIPHFIRYPQDMMFIPVSILFSYFHGFLNVWAALSMQQTQWGSQNLNTLEDARAMRKEVLPLLKDAMDELEPFGPLPTPGHILVGEDYFQATLSAEDKFLRALKK